MAWTPPTVADLEKRYPEFVAYDDTIEQTVLDEAIAEITAGCWIENNRTPATLALAAHWLATTPGAAPDQTGGTGGGGDSGGVALGTIKSRTVGDVRVEYETGATSSSATNFTGGGGALDADFGSTPYGLTYLQLLRRNFPAVAVV
jgi:hypothetical protein